MQRLIELKGKLKTKRFNSMVGSIDSTSGLGPIRRSSRIREIPFSELSEGTNEDVVVIGNVVCSVHSVESVPL